MIDSAYKGALISRSLNRECPEINVASLYFSGHYLKWCLVVATLIVLLYVLQFKLHSGNGTEHNISFFCANSNVSKLTSLCSVYNPTYNTILSVIVILHLT